MNNGKILEAVYGKLGKDTYGGTMSVAPDGNWNTFLRDVNIMLADEYRKVLDGSQNITDDVRPLIKTLGDSNNPALPISTVYGYGQLPEDYIRVVDGEFLQYYNVSCTVSAVNSRPIEILSLKDFRFRMRSGTGLYFPTLEEPIATIQNNQFLVRPLGIAEIMFSYFRMPITPFYDYDIDVTSEQPVYLPPGALHDGTNPDYPAGTPSLSKEYEWPDILESKIVNKLYELATIYLKNYPDLQTSMAQPAA